MFLTAAARKCKTNIMQIMRATPPYFRGWQFSRRPAAQVARLDAFPKTTPPATGRVKAGTAGGNGVGA